MFQTPSPHWLQSSASLAAIDSQNQFVIRTLAFQVRVLFLPPQNYRIGETTFRGYSDHFRTLNGERLPFNPLRGLTVVKRSAVLNGILQRSPLNAPALMLPSPIVLLLQRENDSRYSTLTNSEFCRSSSLVGFLEYRYRKPWPPVGM